MIRRYASYSYGFALGVSVLSTSVEAQHSVEVQRLASKGSYFEALVAYDQLPKRRAAPDATLAAAKSAWALSLPERASEGFEKVLQSSDVDDVKRAQASLSRGVIEYQEGRYQIANVYAQKVLSLKDLPDGLQARAYYLWGEGLQALNRGGAAEEKYRRALEKALPEEKLEMHFALGRCQMALGRHDEARANFELVVSESVERRPEAIRYLAELSMESGDIDGAVRWLSQGQQEYSDFFLDAWVDYALGQAAIVKDDRALLDRIVAKANERFAPSDPWLTLLNAAAEAYRWESGRRKGDDRSQ